jgi:flagellar biosynthesis component FlhA
MIAIAKTSASVRTKKIMFAIFSGLCLVMAAKMMLAIKINIAATRTISANGKIAAKTIMASPPAAIITKQ